MNKLFTVVIPVWNSINYTRPFLEKVFQYFSPDAADIILIDNHSPFTENTSYLNSISIPNVRVYRPSNRPALIPECLNFGYSLATTEFVVVMDDDTEIINLDLNRIKFILDHNLQVGIVSPHLLEGSDNAGMTSYKKYWVGQELFYIPKNTFLGAFMAVRKKDLNDIKHINEAIRLTGPFRQPAQYGHHDNLITQDMLFLLSKCGIYDIKMSIRHIHNPNGTETDKLISIWKDLSIKGFTRLRFDEWVKLHPLGSYLGFIEWVKYPQLKTEEFLSTRLFKDYWNTILAHYYKFRRLKFTESQKDILYEYRLRQIG